MSGISKMVGTRRVDPRAVIRTEILVRQSTSQLFQVTMSDISVSGFKFKSFTSLDSDKMVFVKITGLQTLGAHIRWKDYQDYGCEFSNPLYPAVFEHLVSNLKRLD